MTIPTEEDLMRGAVGAEASLRLSFAILASTLDRFEDDRRFGERLQAYLARGTDDAPAAVVSILHSASLAVADRTGAPVPSRFDPN